MIDILYFIAVAFIFIFLAISVHIFLRALSAKMMTGKWPHEDPLSKAIYDELP